MKKRDFLKTTGAALSGAAVTGFAAITAEGKPGASAISKDAVVAEREWARALSRHVAEQLPEAIRQVPHLRLNGDQVEELRRAFENTLITNMGCEEPPPTTQKPRVTREN